MSLKSLAFIFFPMCVLAQWRPFEDGASLNQTDGRAAADRTQPDAGNRFRFERFDPTNEASLQLNRLNPPLTAEPSDREQAKPISGLISLRQLQHPPSKESHTLVPGSAALLASARRREGHREVGGGHPHRAVLRRSASEPGRPIRSFRTNYRSDDTVRDCSRDRAAGRESLLESGLVLCPARSISPGPGSRPKSALARPG